MKRLFYLGIAAALLLSCSQEEPAAPQQDNKQEQQDFTPKPNLQTGLRSLFINYNGTINKETWVENCSVWLMDDEGKVYYKDDKLSIQGRGNSTWWNPKKPYKIKLSSKVDLIGHGKSKRYVLLANYIDRTLLRNDVAFELARKTSLDWTPSGEFVELYLNGEHLGNYWLGEQIRVETNRLEADYLIEMDTYFDETWKFYSTYGFKPNYWESGLPINVKYPDDDELTAAQFQEIKDLVAGVENALYNGGDFRSKMDLDSFLDWYLVHEVTYNGEPNHPKSCYFHFNKGVMIAGPAWDFDWYTFQPDTQGFFIPKSIYFDQLFKDQSVITRLKERWTELKPKFQEVDDYIAEKAEEIRKSDTINYGLWSCNADVNGDDHLSFEQAITRMREALKSRILVLDQLIKAL